MLPTHHCDRCDDCKALDRIRALRDSLDAEIRALQKVLDAIIGQIWAERLKHARRGV